MQEIESIYRLYFQDVYKYILSLCHDKNIADEITQETFFIAMSKFSAFRHECKIQVWLYQIAKYNYYAYLKRAKMNIVKAPIENLDIQGYRIENTKNHLNFTILVTDGYAESTIDKTIDKDRNMYINVVRPIIKSKNEEGNTMINYGVDIDNVAAIYYGTPDDGALLWTPESELPTLSYQELAEMHDND